MNVLHRNKQLTVIILLKNGVSQHEIARKVCVDRKTVRKYARKIDEHATDSKSPGVPTDSADGVSQNPPPRPPIIDHEVESSRDENQGYARSACEAHREWIEKQVDLGRNAVAIYQDLVELFSFENKYNSVKRFCRKLRKRTPKQFDRLEFLPGEEG